MKILKKIIKWDLRLIERLLLILLLVLPLNSLLCIFIYKIFPLKTQAEIVLWVAEGVTQVVVIVAILTLVINLILKELSHYDLYQLTDISRGKLLFARFCEVCLGALLFTVVGIIGVTMVDGVFLSDYAGDRAITNLCFSSFSMLGRPILCWLFPIGVMISSGILYAVALLFCGLYTLKKDNLAGMCFSLFVSVGMVLCVFFGYSGLNFYFPFDFNHSLDLTGIVPYNLLEYSFRMSSTEFSRCFLLTVNIFSPFSALYLMAFAGLCVCVYSLCKRKIIKGNGGRGK